MGNDFLTVAEAFKGYAEDNPRLAAFLMKNGYDINPTKTAWCAAFVGAVLNACGYEGTHKLNARSYLNWGIHVPINESKPGDVVILKRGIFTWQGHVGFKAYGEPDPADEDKIPLFGGNQDNRACHKQYPKSMILGVRRVGR